MKLHLLAGLASLAAISGVAFAADHIDAPTAVSEPAVDIGDFFAWMTPDAESLNLIMTVAPFATEASGFSDAAVYAFHVNSSMGYGMAQTETQVLCSFTAMGNVECWVGDEYVSGDPTGSGITSDSGMVRVFAGLRNDPFFFALGGFQAAVGAVKAAAPSLTFDADGCPGVDADTSAALVGLLQSDGNGGPAVDSLAGVGVLALVVQVDKSLLTAGGPLLSAWSSTHRAQ